MSTRVEDNIHIYLEGNKTIFSNVKAVIRDSLETRLHCQDVAIAKTKEVDNLKVDKLKIINNNLCVKQ